MIAIESKSSERIEAVIRQAAAEIAEIVREDVASVIEQALSGLRTMPLISAPNGNGNGHHAEEEESELDAAPVAPVAVKTAEAKKTKVKAPSGVTSALAASGSDEETVVYNFVKENPRLRSEEIQRGLSEKLAGDVVKAQLAKLRAQGKMKIKGNRRAAKYTATA